MALLESVRAEFTNNCTDQSEYPDHHTFYAFATGSDVHHYITQVVENVASGPSQPIQKTFEKLLAALHIASKDPEGEDDDEDYEGYDADNFGINQTPHTTFHRNKLQK